MIRRKSHRSEEGFALIVITSLFVAFALVAAAMIDRTNATQQLNQYEKTQAQLRRINAALIQYALFNTNHYPCPAATNVVATDVPFGTSTANCDSTIPGGTAILTGAVPVPNRIIQGMVPVTALAPYGIDPNDAFDAWNNRIMYVVDRVMTNSAMTVPTPDTSRSLITELKTPVAFRRPDFIVLSYGRDGLGAIPRNLTAVAIPCPGAGVEPRRINCDGDINFTIGPPTLAASTKMSEYFDDLLSFHTSAASTTCPGRTLSWGTGSPKPCSATFQALPWDATSQPTANTAVNYSGIAQATCSKVTGIMTISGTPSCNSGACNLSNTVTTSAGIIPGVCPPPTGNVYVTSQTSTHGAAGCTGGWSWIQYMYDPNPADHCPVAKRVTHCTQDPPTPYINNCGVVNGPVPTGTGFFKNECKPARLYWGKGCYARFPALPAVSTLNGSTAAGVNSDPASGYTGIGTALCKADNTWDIPTPDPAFPCVAINACANDYSGTGTCYTQNNGDATCQNLLAADGTTVIGNISCTETKTNPLNHSKTMPVCTKTTPGGGC